jgi:autotransporter-associated beta strand protein
LKVGRVRTHFSPNPFAASSPLSQTLNFYNGEIDITSGPSGSQVCLRIYIDANQPVIRMVASGQQYFTMSCSNEIWRGSIQTINSGDSGSFRGVAGASPAPSESADQALALPDRLVWYHQNASSYFNALFQAENLNGYAASYADPWTNRIFGATILAANFSVVNNQQLQSSSGTNFMVSIYPCTAQTRVESAWQTQMNNQIAQVNATSEATARTNHYAWWDGFWNRSWIFVGGDANATTVTRGYLEQRFMDACQGRGQYPIKFNGGTFTFDYNGQNGDYRQWGPGYWHQNTRLLYWPMLASGDFDMMPPFFNMYTNMLPLQTAATSNYYGHGGAFFPETFNIFGLYEGDDWGWNDSSATTCGNSYIMYHYQGGLETLAMMLAYYDYTQDSSFATNYIVPMATQVIRFFNEHWSKVNGKLFFYPANALETYWSCTNSTDYISGLMDDIRKLMALPANLTTTSLLNEWSNCYACLPPLPMDPTGSYVKPAQTYGSPENIENPECYCIFPYRLYGIDLPNFNVGLATFKNRTIQDNKYDWSQDVIEEPLVGLTNAAQIDVINNFDDTDPSARFQAFWTSRNDYLPCEDTGATAMTGLQFMLMQCVGSQIQLLPSWPAGWSVDFKLNAPSNTTVRLVIQHQIVTQLTVTPSSRMNDLINTNVLVEATAQTPVFDPVGGSYFGSQLVTVAADPSTTIHYTTDGSNPTNSASVISAVSPISIRVPSNTTETIMAYSTVALHDSAVAGATYVTTSLSPPVWTNVSGGSWAVAANWSNGVVGCGGATADFSQLTLPGDATVTLDGSWPIGNLIFGDKGNSHNWNLYAGVGGSLTLAGSNPTITVNSKSVTIGAVLAGNSGLLKAGAGTLTLTNANTGLYGSVVVYQGTLEIDAEAAAGTGTIALSNNGALNVNISLNTLANPITGSGTINVIETANNNTTLGGSMSGFTGTLNCPGSPGGAAKVCVQSTGVDFNSNATINVASGGTLFAGSVVGILIPSIIYVAGNGNSEGYGALRPDDGSTFSGPVTLLGNIAIGEANNNGTISGPIGDGGMGYGITKVGGAGTSLTLSGTNSYSGTTLVNDGALVIASTGSISNSSNIAIAAGATFNVANVSGGFFLGAAQTLTGLGASGTINGSVTMNSGSLALACSSGVATLIVTEGTLTLNNNAATVAVSGGALAAGSYPLIACSASGLVAGSVANSPLTIGGTGLAAGSQARLQISSNALYLVVSTVTHPVFAAVSPTKTGAIWLSFTGPSQQSYSILTATNLLAPLANWTTIDTGTFAGGTVIYTNMTATNSAGFYIILCPLRVQLHGIKYEN